MYASFKLSKSINFLYSPPKQGPCRSQALLLKMSLCMGIWKTGTFPAKRETSHHSGSQALHWAGLRHFKAPCHLNKLETENEGMRKEPSPRRHSPFRREAEPWQPLMWPCGHIPP